MVKRTLIQLILLFTYSLHCASALAAHNISAKQAELEKVSSQIQQLQKNLNADLNEKTTLEQELQDRELLLAKLAQQIASINRDLANEANELARLKLSQQKLLTQLTHQREALAEQLRMMYRLGNMQSLKTVLNPDNVSTMDRQLHYYHYLNEARSKLVGDVRQTLSGIDHNLAAITEHEATLKTLLQTRQQQQANALQAQQQREGVVHQLAITSQDKQAQLTSLVASQKALQDMINSLNTKENVTPSNNKRFDQLTGKLDWPLQGTIATGAHGGYIISAPEGTPVHAIYGGKVIFANWLRGFGLLVIINHGNGFMSLYARNQALFTKAGETVSPRDIIATIGKSGGFTNPSLYFEIRQNGSPVNAMNWCRT